MNQSTYALIFALMAGISTGIGGLITVFFKRPSSKVLSVMLGFSAGIMIYLSFIEIYQEAQDYLCSTHGEKTGKILATLAFFFGIAITAIINEVIPEPGSLSYTGRAGTTNINIARLYRTGIFTALAVTLHNFPEGIATYISGIKSPALGLSIALAIAVHNIPEGISIAVPVYYATKSKVKAFSTALLSGFSEPLGAILTMLVLGQYITDSIFGLIFGCVAGIMVYISFVELLPSAREYGDNYTCGLGLLIGMAAMALSVLIIF
ncbi:MAG: zinc transporter ZupT [Clostridiaceae bacterium]|nr:zinc transporter ZupT [Clostridiaceae bacterium]